MAGKDYKSLQKGRIATIRFETKAEDPALTLNNATILKKGEGLKNVVSDLTMSVATEVGKSDRTYRLALKGNFPNPFNPQTNIVYTLDRKRKVKLLLYSITGSKIRELVNQVQSRGRHTYRFSGETLSSGVYLYKLITGEKTMVGKMTLIK